MTSAKLICRMIDKDGDEYATHEEGENFYFTIESEEDIFFQSENYATATIALQECLTQLRIDNAI